MSGPVCTCGEDGWCPVHHVACACANALGDCLSTCVCAADGVREAQLATLPCDCRATEAAEAMELAWQDAANNRIDRELDDEAFLEAMGLGL